MCSTVSCVKGTRHIAGPYTIGAIRYPLVTCRKGKKEVTVHLNRVKLYKSHEVLPDPNLEPEAE